MKSKHYGSEDDERHGLKEELYGIYCFVKHALWPNLTTREKASWFDKTFGVYSALEAYAQEHRLEAIRKSLEINSGTFSDTLEMMEREIKLLASSEKRKKSLFKEDKSQSSEANEKYSLAELREEFDFLKSQKSSGSLSQLNILKEEVKKRCKGYELKLMSELPEKNNQKAEKGKIYLSQDGGYVVHNFEGEIFKGDINTKDIVLENLDAKIKDPTFREKILEATSKARHTQYKYTEEIIIELNNRVTAKEKKINNDYCLHKEMYLLQGLLFSARVELKKITNAEDDRPPRTFALTLPYSKGDNSQNNMAYAANYLAYLFPPRVIDALLSKAEDLAGWLGRYDTVLYKGHYFRGKIGYVTHVLSVIMFTVLEVIKNTLEPFIHPFNYFFGAYIRIWELLPKKSERTSSDWLLFGLAVVGQTLKVACFVTSILLTAGALTLPLNIAFSAINHFVVPTVVKWLILAPLESSLIASIFGFFSKTWVNPKKFPKTRGDVNVMSFVQGAYLKEPKTSLTADSIKSMWTANLFSKLLHQKKKKVDVPQKKQENQKNQKRDLFSVSLQSNNP